MTSFSPSWKLSIFCSHCLECSLSRTGLMDSSPPWGLCRISTPLPPPERTLTTLCCFVCFFYHNPQLGSFFCLLVFSLSPSLDWKVLRARLLHSDEKCWTSIVVRPSPRDSYHASLFLSAIALLTTWNALPCFPVYGLALLIRRWASWGSRTGLSCWLPYTQYPAQAPTLDKGQSLSIYV